MIVQVNAKPDSATRIECYNTGVQDSPVSLHLSHLRIEMPVAELIRIRAAINQWVAQHPELTNGLVVNLGLTNDIIGKRMAELTTAKP